MSDCFKLFCGNEDIRKLKLTQELIGGLTGVHRVSAVRSIQKLKQDGILDYTQKQIKLLDYDRLFETVYGKYSL